MQYKGQNRELVDVASLSPITANSAVPLGLLSDDLITCRSVDFSQSGACQAMDR
jgi:hypothetical protein